MKKLKRCQHCCTLIQKNGVLYRYMLALVLGTNKRGSIKGVKKN